VFSRILQTLRLGVYSLLLHKLRSGLAVLGILIGVTAVIWLVAMGEGVSYQAQQQIKDLGANNIIVRSVKPVAQTSSNFQLFIPYGILRDDYARILSNIPVIQQAVPMRVLPREIRNGSRAIEARLVGCTPDYLTFNRLTVQRGRFINAVDGDPPTNVCVLGAKTAQALFPLSNPIGQSVQIDRDFYVVVGQTAERDPTAAIGGSLESQDYNSDIYIPLQTLRVRIGDTVFTSRSGSLEGEIVQLSQITLRVANTEDVEKVSDIVRALMERYHPSMDFAVVVPKELLRQAEVTRLIFNVLLVFIAGISLLVGGIGIMNIMLATVTERTREIGIRRALGARRANIVQQFLVESVVLTGVGGSLGVAFGFLCNPTIEAVRALAVQFFPQQLAALPASVLQLEPRIAPWSIFASLIIAILVGMVFGMYPAYRAANMDPIEALRHE
jgi:putative ABC transport system permease protein